MNKKFVIAATCLLLLFFVAGNVFAQPRRSAVIKIGANVPGAKVYLDNVLIGNSPVETKVIFGNHVLRVVADGYEVYQKTIAIGHDQGIVVELKPLPVQFNVSINSDPRGAAVSIDGRNAGRTPLRTRLLQGQHEVRVTMAGFDPYVQTVDVAGDVNLMAELQRRIREFDLSVTANVRGAQVSVDDNMLGRAPFRGRIQEGRHTVKVAADGYEEFTRNLDVNGNIRLNAVLRRIPRTFTLSVQTNVDRAQVSINGQEQDGFAPMDLRLPEGQYTVRVTRRGYGAYQTVVTLNRDARVQANLALPKAKIVIQAPERRGPGGLRLTISLDGRRVNGTEFEVERGRHTVRVEAGGLVAEREVDCREGRVYRFRLDLDLQAPREEDVDDDGGR